MSSIFDTIEYIKEEYGSNSIMVRRSSGGFGWHILLPFVRHDVEEDLKERRQHEDCRGRCAGDEVRIRSKFRTGRLFESKSRYEERKRVKVGTAGEWMMLSEWNRRYGNEVRKQIEEMECQD